MQNLLHMFLYTACYTSKKFKHWVLLWANVYLHIYIRVYIYIYLCIYMYKIYIYIERERERETERETDRDCLFISVVHNVRPAGHIRPATGPRVARGVQQEK